MSTLVCAGLVVVGIVVLGLLKELLEILEYGCYAAMGCGVLLFLVAVIHFFPSYQGGKAPAPPEELTGLEEPPKPRTPWLRILEDGEDEDED